MSGDQQNKVGGISNQLSFKENKPNKSAFSIKVEYKLISFPSDEVNNMKYKGISFIQDQMCVFVDTDQDAFILGLDNHTYLEFQRVPNSSCFKLIGVRPLNSLNDSRVIWLRGELIQPDAGALYP